MHPLTATALRICFRFSLFVLALPLLAHARLPEAANVPGGVAIVPLGSVSTEADKPQTWLGDQPILVTSDNGQWYAVVGIPLDMTPGSHELSVKIGDETKAETFVVNPKDYPEQRITLKDTSKIELSATDLARAQREIADIRALEHHWRVTQDTDLALIVPAQGRLASRFGLRRFFNDEPRSPHAGLDVAVASGTPVKSSAQGKVLAVGDYFFNGKTVFVDHGNGLITMYCHLERIDVQTGETVNKGQRLGLSGQTGRASGPHLHWSVVLNGTMVDPELFISAEQHQ
ncbi:MAG: peptidoglycan DD-metalloendopeptidase family protein [Gammaproteobacteria bacterium]|nr:peptidoglycan DD-metalloendopeptidase family protein [Gammaproteobacteria bacterium]MBU1480696.1 peptidoglycan DD-metalloendopeptidase family protein [Gammaproteobacteria bacterium]